ncbi:MAG: VOC family protein [Dermatophilaceae bacterium]
MATLDHAALYVTDLDVIRDFYCTHLGARSNEGYHNPTTGLRTYFLTFGGTARLEIMTRPEVSQQAAQAPGDRPLRLGWDHLAFTVGSPQEVDALTDRLRREGMEILSGPRTTGDGYYETLFLDPEGNRVEIVADRATG